MLFLFYLQYSLKVKEEHGEYICSIFQNMISIILWICIHWNKNNTRCDKEIWNLINKNNVGNSQLPSSNLFYPNQKYQISEFKLMNLFFIY